MTPKDTPPNERQKFWQGHVERWQQSGQNQAGYCREQGLSDYQFRWWKRRFATPAPEVAAPAVNFIPVQVASAAPLPASPAPERHDSGVRLWAGGVRIDLAPGFHRATLRAALEVLGA